VPEGLIAQRFCPGSDGSELFATFDVQDMQTLTSGILRSFPWSPSLPVDKPFKPAVVDIPQPAKIKRKRIGASLPSPRSLQPKKIRLDGGAVQGSDVVAPEGFDPTSPPSTVAASKMAAGLCAQSKVAAAQPMPKPAVAIASASAPVTLVPEALKATPVTCSAVSSQQATSKPASGHVGSEAPAVESAAAEDVTPTGSQVPEQASMELKDSFDVQSQPLPQHTTMSSESMEERLKSILLAQINQAILFKHNEMRLIDQEIAKCQIALEQIRRCERVPYPGSQSPSAAVSHHFGPALVTPAGMSAPSHPAPWGVTDGPYSRHYAQWLIPSSVFEPTSFQPQTPAFSPFSRDNARATRGSGAETAPFSCYSARSGRIGAGRTRSVLDPQSPREVKDPLVLKRQKDGKWVKLYCSSCLPERSDFANVQGFLNHCRISHKQDFKSHEAAAIACGREVEGGEIPMVQTPAVMTPRESISFFTSAPPSAAKPVVSAGVHPLNQRLTEVRKPIDQIVPYSPVTGTGSGTVTPQPSPGFVASTANPHLSSLLQKRGFSGNFETIVEEMKRKEDLSVYDDAEAEATEQPIKKGKKTPKAARNGTTSHPGKSSMSVQGSSGMKPSSFASSQQHAGRRPGSSGMHSSLPRLATDHVPVEQHEDLSPHTAESNPGLVSDRDDDDVDIEDASSDQQQPVDADEMMIDIEDSDVERRDSNGASQRNCAN
jgi:ADA HAT complex component 1